jgi:hypothetical protein
MKTKKSLITLITISIMIYLLSSCLEDAYTFDTFLVKIDSFQLPETMTAKTTFEVRFFGTVGNNGCISFEGFNQNLINKDIEIEAWGRYDNRNNTCPEVMVYLDKNLEITIPVAGVYNLKIKQPDKSYLERSITVK